MDAQKTGARSGRVSSVEDTYGSLMRKAAGVLRLRYVQCSQDSGLSPAAAEELAEVFDRIAEGDPAFDQIDPKEAIALAQRLLDDDHPELSRLWPTGG